MAQFDRKISEFITSEPLYSKLLVDNDFILPNVFNGLTFNFHCPVDEEIKTFELEVYPINFPWHNHLPNMGLSFWKDTDDNTLITQQYKGICKHCKNYHIDIILNTFIEEKEKTASRVYLKTYIQKIGQFPPFEITPESYLIKYLNKEDKVNYKKGLLLLSQSYGIGAYAYYRRIVENEILRIIKDISKLDFADAEKIKILLRKYEENHQMSKLIEGIYKYLPDSLKSLDNNPLKVLHEQLSQGIHSLSEADCLEKSKLIDTLLKFVIKRLNEEQSMVLDAKVAMKKLTS